MIQVSKSFIVRGKKRERMGHGGKKGNSGIGM
jgi:hypothetical protein